MKSIKYIDKKLFSVKGRRIMSKFQKVIASIVLCFTLISISIAKNPAADYRYLIKSQEFKYDEGEKGWVAKTEKVEFPYDELIYSWSIHLSKGEGMRLFLKAGFDDGSSSPWLYAGYWGSVELIGDRKNPEFEKGYVDMDTLKLKEKASSFQFKVMSDGENPLSVCPDLHVIITDTNPNETLSKKYNLPISKDSVKDVKIMDLPLRLQQDSKGNPLPDRCQSAAVATAMEYYGKNIGLENIIPYTTDSEYHYFGIWPRTIEAAIEFGFDAYIDRFRNWDYVRKTLKEGKVILCSINMPENDNYIAPPYPYMSGHIVALNGVTDDGRVVVTDSALRRNNRGYLCQWKVEDFQKVWMQNKGGVGMVICPPKGFQEKDITELAPFPKRDYKPKTTEKTN